MALVSYDYDSASEDEEVEETPTQNTTQITNNKETDAHKNIFSSLPNTKSFKTIEIPEHVIEDFVPKPVQVKPKVKITIPSLSDFQNDQDSDEDEPSTKRNKPSPAGSGLIAILPPVRGSIKTSTSFVPKVLTTKKKPTASTLIPRNVTKPKPKPINRNITKSNIPKPNDSDTEDESELPETFDDAMWEKVCGRPKPKRVVEEPLIEQPEELVNIAPEPEKPYEGLDNQAFKDLIGKSKRPVGNIKLIDINEEEILADKDLWMAKAMTDPEMAPKAAVEDPVDPTKRKKHHITYLAQQARANEQDLKNAWAASKNNRLASRSKYGF